MITLSSPRLHLRPLTACDWELFVQLHTDDSVIALCFDKPTQAEIDAKFQSRLPPWTPQATHWLCLTVVDKHSGEKLGITGFFMDQGCAEVGFLFLPQYHGQGYATESLQVLIDYAMQQGWTDRFRAVVTEGNQGSERVLVKCGFQLHQVVPDAYQINGIRYADHIYQR